LQGTLVKVRLPELCSRKKDTLLSRPSDIAYALQNCADASEIDRASEQKARGGRLRRRRKSNLKVADRDN
jgi:hypothetical protein